MTVLKLLKSFHADESGQGLVEYLLVVALVGLAAIAGMGSAATYINNAFATIGAKLENSVGT
jgi:Flp pilus assembly pilin Flp